MNPAPTLPTLAELNDPGLFTPPAAPASSARAMRTPHVRESLAIVLVDAGRPGDPPMDVRLANALKTLGRRFRLRVQDLKTLEAAPRG